MNLGRLDWCGCSYEDESFVCIDCKECSYCFNKIRREDLNRHELTCLYEVLKMRAKTPKFPKGPSL